MPTNSLLKNYIHHLDITDQIRNDVVFSDASKIRIYEDNARLGARLRGSFNKWSQKIEFSLDTDITIQLPQWEPQAVKSWEGFEEISSKPTGTAVDWRVSDGTSDYWYNGAAWAIVALGTDWNTEVEISTNINTFPHIQKKIHFVARLKTTNKNVTPVLFGYKLLITASFDWFEDLVIRSLVPRMREDFRFLMDWSGVLDSTTDRFNVKTDYNFTPEESLNIIGIEAVYNHDTDPGYETDLLSSFNASTGLAILTGAVASGTRLFYRLILDPEIIVNFQNVDYTEIGKTPCIIIDKVDIPGRQVEAISEISLKDRNSGRKFVQPLWCEHVRFQCSLLTGKTVNISRLLTQAYAFSVRGSTQQTGHKPGGILKTVALDLEHTLRVIPKASYNPKTNFSDLKELGFEIFVYNFYAWLRDMSTEYIVSNFDYTLDDMKDVGTGNPNYDLQPLPGGADPALYQYPEVEET
jgi:hypothetical protein